MCLTELDMLILIKSSIESNIFIRRKLFSRACIIIYLNKKFLIFNMYYGYYNYMDIISIMAIICGTILKFFKFSDNFFL